MRSLLATGLGLCLAALAVVEAAPCQEIYMPHADWLTHAWAKKDPFEGLRQKVEAEYKAAPDKGRFVHALAQRARERRKFLLRYLLASYLLSQDAPDFSLEAAYSASLRLYQPTSREAARARFLVSAGYAWNAELCALGERLLATHEEFDVRYQLGRMRMYDINSSMKGYGVALQGAKVLLEGYPDRGKVHALLGGIYYWGFKHLHIKGDRVKAISEYKLYLASNPPKALW